MNERQHFGDILHRHREIITSFTTVQCSMQHETVTSIPDAATGTECERRDLCPREFRNRQLACGHTTSRNTLRIAVEDMRSAKQYLRAQQSSGAGVSSFRSSSLLARIEQLNSDIGRLDHAKGDTELLYAIALDTQAKGDEDTAEQIGVLEEKRARIHERHAQYILQMQELRDDILAALDSLLAQLSPVASTERQA